ncbi:uncharacterized protein F5Z01DRAFT_134560 [Emericellopsis atlantica]|uniref:Uncharacterized protein n=1 Tax=Emericellopsis atlantica TaxID=2614577 RepID=A0A9P7ZLG9_9HYPO|nr:uncharacterized protein F5Z01DRAFT_134560 [Emericellopsis atlantica]KAG9253892.1 hypothetical protein F5Z01DRAFT_134560 [Emericellopsis atlantica]
MSTAENPRLGRVHYPRAPATTFRLELPIKPDAGQGSPNASLRTLEALLQLRAELLFLGMRKVNEGGDGSLDLITFCSRESSKFFDGFRTVWQIPKRVKYLRLTDQDASSRKARLLDQQHGLLHSPSGVPNDDLISALLTLMEQEVEEHCVDVWDYRRDISGAAPMSWAEVRHEYDFCDLADMVVRSRLRRQEMILPGYFRVYILDMNDDGRMMACLRVIPKNISLQELLVALERWRPAHCPCHERLIQGMQDRINAIYASAPQVPPELLRESKNLKSHLHRPWFTPGPGSERNLWACRSFSPPSPFILKSVNGAATREFAILSEESVLNNLKQSVDAGKVPVIVRPWIVRLRHVVPKLNDLYRRLHNYSIPSGFSPEEDAILDRYMEQQGEAEG